MFEFRGKERRTFICNDAEKGNLSMKRHSIRLGIGAVVAAAALVLSACTGSTTPQSTTTSTADASQTETAGPEQITRGHELAIGVLGAPTTLIPLEAGVGQQLLWFTASYDTLIRMTGGGELEPMLAESWKYNDDSTQLTLKLRNDVKFTDGSALTAGVVKANLDNYIASEGLQANLIREVSSVEAPDDSTVVITLSEPNPAFLEMLTGGPGLIVSEAALGTEDLATTPVGSGPYLLDTASTVYGSEYIWNRNPDYWDPSLQHYEKLRISVYPDATAMFNAIMSGAIQGAQLQDNHTIPQIEGAGWTILPSEVRFRAIWMFDRSGATVPALADVRVRKAINMALDRQGLLDAIDAGAGAVTTQVFPPYGDGFDPALDAMYPFDVEAAKALMAEAGYADGFTVTFPAATRTPASVYNLVAQALGEINITINYEEVPSGLTAKIQGGDYAMAYFHQEVPSEWDVVQRVIATGGAMNPLAPADPIADALVERVRNGDAAAAKELNKYVVENAWNAPLFREIAYFAVNGDTTAPVPTKSVTPPLYEIAPKG